MGREVYNCVYSEPRSVVWNFNVHVSIYMILITDGRTTFSSPYGVLI